MQHVNMILTSALQLPSYQFQRDKIRLINNKMLLVQH